MTQRQIQNRRLRELKALRKASGLCVVCGKKSRQGKVCCQKCSDKSAARYREATGKPPLPIKKTKKVPMRLTGGVARRVMKDGYGRAGVYYCAEASIAGKQRSRKFSVDAHGVAGSQMLAALQKMMWLVETKAWNPADGDPLALLGYMDAFGGNRDYDNCVIEKTSSPWIQEYENVA
jgi:hypothetical protein